MKKHLFFLILLVFPSLLYALPQDGFVSSSQTCEACALSKQGNEAWRLVKGLSSVTQKINSTDKSTRCDAYYDPKEFCKCVDKEKIEISDNTPANVISDVRSSYPSIDAIREIYAYAQDYKGSINALYCSLYDAEVYRTKKLYRQIMAFYSFKNLNNVSDEQLAVLAESIKEVILSKVVPDDQKKNLIPFLSKILDVKDRGIIAKVSVVEIVLSDDEKVMALLPSLTSDELRKSGGDAGAATELYKKTVEFTHQILYPESVSSKNSVSAIKVASAVLKSRGDDSPTKTVKEEAKNALRIAVGMDDLAANGAALEVLQREADYGDEYSSNVIANSGEALLEKVKDKKNLKDSPVGYTALAKSLWYSSIEGGKKAAVTAVYSAISSDNPMARFEAAKIMLADSERGRREVYQDLGVQKANAIMETMLESGSDKEKSEAARVVLSREATNGGYVDKVVREKAINTLKTQIKSDDKEISQYAASVANTVSVPADLAKESQSITKSQHTLFSLGSTLEKTSSLNASTDANNKSAVSFVNKNLLMNGGIGSGGEEGGRGISAPAPLYTPSPTVVSTPRPIVESRQQVQTDNSAKSSARVGEASKSSGRSQNNSSDNKSSDSSLSNVVYKNPNSGSLFGNPNRLGPQTTVIEKTVKVDDKGKKKQADGDDEEEEDAPQKKRPKKPDAGNTTYQKQEYSQNQDSSGSLFDSSKNSGSPSSNASSSYGDQSGAQQAASTPGQNKKDQYKDVSSDGENAVGGGVGGGGGGGIADSSGGGSSGVNGGQKGSAEEMKEADLENNDNYIYPNFLPYKELSNATTRESIIRLLKLEGMNLRAYSDKTNGDKEIFIYVHHSLAEKSEKERKIEMKKIQGWRKAPAGTESFKKLEDLRKVDIFGNQTYKKENIEITFKDAVFFGPQAIKNLLEADKKNKEKQHKGAKK